MHHHLAYGGVLALSSGVPRDTSPRVYIPAAGSTLPKRDSRILLALVEPIEPGAGVDELAEHVIAALVAGVDRKPASEAAARLIDAFGRANELVLAANRGRSSRRIMLGVTCAVAAGRDLLVAHVPPSQLIVRQGRTLFAYPDISAWSLPIPAIDAPLARPLGLQRETEPALLFTSIAPGDVVCICTTTTAALLSGNRMALEAATNGDDVMTIVGGRCDQADLRDGAVGIVDISSSRHASQSLRPRETVSTKRASSSAPGRRKSSTIPRSSRLFPLDHHAPAVQTERAHDEADSSNQSALAQAGAPVAATPPEVSDCTDEWPVEALRSEFHAVIPWQDVRSAHAEGERSGSGSSTGFRSPAWPTVLTTIVALPAAVAGIASSLVEQRERIAAFPTLARSSMVTNLLAGLLLGLVATVVGVWTVTRRDRPLHGPRDDGTLGLPRLQRWNVSYRPPRMQRLRSSLPRLEAGRIVVIGILLIALLAGGMYGFSRLRAPSAANAEQFEEQFQLILSRHSDALNETDQPTAYAILIEARTRVEELAASLPDGSVDSRVEQQRVSIQSDIDQLTNLSRFTTVNVIGSVPAAPENVNPRLIAGGGRVYLLSDALYQLDSANASLVRLIASGDRIGEQTVGTIRGAVWRGDRPIVVDETSTWNLDPATGLWTREELGTFDAAGYVAVGAVEAFELNLYMLATDSGQILKFPAGGYAGSPEDWANGVPSDDLAQAVDLAVDGHIWALMPDGRILNMFRSRVEAEVEPLYVPPLDSAISIAAMPNSPYLYVLNASDGRIVRLARDGRIIQQFTTSMESSLFEDATDFVIDEGTGVAFVLAGDTIYSVRIPAPTS